MTSVMNSLFRFGLALVATAACSIPYSPMATAQSGIEDYRFSTPLPQTGKVTIRRSLKAFNRQRMFTACPKNSRLYAFAESTHYLVQICAQQGVPRYYLSKGKQDGSRLTIEDRDSSRTRQLIFANKDYLYILYRDGARPERINAYLQVFRKDQQILGEALLYLYEG